MANAIGYEELSITSDKASGPDTVATLSANGTLAGGVRSAIFYVDPESTGRVRWRSDGSDPTNDYGLPFSPGAEIVLVGEANIRRAKFITESGSAHMYAVYYDQVDIAVMGLNGVARSNRNDTANNSKLDEIIRLLTQIRNCAGEIAFETIGDSVPSDN